MRIIKSLFLLIAVCSCITVSAQKEITLEGIWKYYQFVPSYIRGFESMPNSDYYTVKDMVSISKHSFETGKEIEEILSNNMLKKASDGKLTINDIDEYTFDNSCKKILLSTEGESIYRRSTRYNVRHALKGPLTVRCGNWEDLPAFCALMEQTAVKQHFVPRQAP